MFHNNKKDIEIMRESSFILGAALLILGVVSNSILPVQVALTFAVPLYVLSLICFIKMTYWDLVSRIKGFDKK